MKLRREPSVLITAIERKWAGEVVDGLHEFPLLERVKRPCHRLQLDVGFHGASDGMGELADAFAFVLWMDDAGDRPHDGAIGAEEKDVWCAVGGDDAELSNQRIFKTAGNHH